jgi:hypothetical protein
LQLKILAYSNDGNGLVKIVELAFWYLNVLGKESIGFFHSKMANPFD